jgi:crossover junction endodeoxyribonuclease RusA
MTSVLIIKARGIPRPGGSKRAIPYRVGNRVRVNVVESGRHTAAWREIVSVAAAQAMGGKPPFAGVPLAVDVAFVMPRPRSHYRTGKRAGELRPDAPYWHTSKPDATKLMRAVEDAMTGIVWADDALVATHTVCKVYGNVPGMTCTVTEMITKGSE